MMYDNYPFEIPIWQMIFPIPNIPIDSSLSSQ